MIDIEIMKTSILRTVFLLMFISTMYIQSQAQEEKPVEFGIKAGLNISDFNSKDGATTDLIPGFNVGVFSKLPLTTLIAFQSELSLTTKGATVTYNSLLLDGSANFNLTYLEMPLLCVFNVTNRVNLQVGPYVAYLLDAKVTNKSNVTLFNFEQNLNTDNYNRIDAGIVFGAGIDVHGITMGARYNLGLTKVGKTQSFLGTNYIIPNSTNGVMSFYLAISFL